MPDPVPEGYTSARRLCDDDGIVGQALAVPQPWGDDFLTYRGLHNRLARLSGREPITEDFPCTGSAHYASEHIYCTSPAHDRDPDAPGGDEDVWPVSLSRQARKIFPTYTAPGGGTANAD